MKRSKGYTAVAEKVDKAKLYAPAEALEFAKANTAAKFDETVDVAMRLGVDPRKADQMVRGTVSLPNRTGKTCGSSSSPPASGRSRRRRPGDRRGRCRRADREDHGRLSGL